MTKTFLYRLFGFGKIPAHLAAQLKTEGIVLLDEGIRGSTTYRNFRSPNRYAGWKRQWYTASLVLTEARLFALGFSRTIIDVPLEDERLGRVSFSLEANGTLLVAFDAGLFRQDWSGKIEYRFRTQYGQAFLDKLREAT